MATNNGEWTHVGSTYTEEEIIFLKAVEHWQHAHNRKFPTFVEILQLAKSLGYRKVPVSTDGVQDAEVPVSSGYKRRRKHRYN